MKYYVKEWGETSAQACAVPGARWADDPDDFASCAGEHIHDERDGWESQWPIVVTVVEENGKETDFSVEREYNPSFYASEVK
jgi:hypothetical protein